MPVREEDAEDALDLVVWRKGDRDLQAVDGLSRARNRGAFKKRARSSSSEGSSETTCTSVLISPSRAPKALSASVKALDFMSYCYTSCLTTARRPPSTLRTARRARRRRVEG